VISKGGAESRMLEGGNKPEIGMIVSNRKGDGWTLVRLASEKGVAQFRLDVVYFHLLF
jgi:hypothetical protein